MMMLNTSSLDLVIKGGYAIDRSCYITNRLDLCAGLPPLYRHLNLITTAS